MSRRIRTGVDISRLSAAVSRPGIDPRIWVSWAIVKELGFDPVQGLFADVILQPTGENETIYIGTTMAGDGFGDWDPIEIDETVVIMFPNGDPNSGGILIGRTWNGGDPPPAVIGSGDEPVKDSYKILKDGRTYHVHVGDGQNIMLGDDLAVALTKAQAFDDLKNALIKFVTGLTPQTLAANAAQLNSDLLQIVDIKTKKAFGS